MNSIQFEYGVTLGVRTPRDLRIAFEYARTSQHPFRTGYSEVSLDILELALYPEPVRLGSAWRGDIDLAIRLAHIDLYDFWESPLKAPRTRFRIEVPVGGSWDLGAGRGTLVARAWPRILFMRQRRAWPYANVDPLVQAEIDAEIGVRLARQSGIELLLEFFATGDTEQVSGEPAPLTTLGLVARLTM